MTRLSLKEARALGIIPAKPKQKKMPRPNPVQWDAKTFRGGMWIQVPFVPPSLNVWMKWHWTEQRRYKEELLQNMQVLKMAFKLPQYKFATVQIIHYFATVRRRDADNMAPKFALDALVRGGILEDDRDDWIKVMPPGMECDRERPRTEIFIWEEATTC